MKLIKQILPVIILATLSCNASRQTVKNTVDNKTPEIKNIACAGMVPASAPHIDWVKEKQRVLNDATVQLPGVYDVYSIDSVQLLSFFRDINNSDTDLHTPIPLPDGCQLFDITSANQKPRNNIVISAKGLDAETKLNEIHLTYSITTGMSGQADWEGRSYIIKAVKSDDHTYYILYPRPMKQFTHGMPGSPAAPASLRPSGSH